MTFEIKNRVSESKLITIDFNDFIADFSFENFDIKPWLKDGLVLIEKDFREKAIKTYEVGRKVFGDSDMFALDLATVYRVMGEKEKMIREYLHFSKTAKQSI